MKTLRNRLSRPLLLGACLAAGAARAEVIRSYNADIYLKKDAELSVLETIVMDFEDSPRHGIYRNIPVKYKRHGAGYTIGLHIDSVTESGGGVPFKVTHEGGDVKVRIGDPDRTVQGVHTYRIGYTVRRAINYFGADRAPEVYWNVTGNEWPFRMASVRARFFPPDGVRLSSIRTACYVGSYGSTTPGHIKVEGKDILFTGGPLLPEDGLTIVAGLPAGSVSPSLIDRLYSLFGGWLAILLAPLLAGLVLWRKWLSSGRDVGGGKPVAVEWEPPKNLSPAEVGTLVDEKCDMADIVSTLVDLAARGYLKIQVVETKTLFFFSNRDYIFTRVRPSDANLSEHERLFLSGLFTGGNDTTTLSELHNKFYTHLPLIRNAIYDELTQKRMFARNPQTVRQTYVGFGIAIAIAGGVMIAAMQGEMLPVWIGVIIAGGMTAAMGKAMPAKTPEGSQALYEALGFKRFVRMAEKRRIEVLAKDDPTIFGRLLPYAMVLGVADQWADAFKDLMTEPPDWFTGPGYSHGFSSHVFINDLGSGMKTMGSTFASAPSSAGSGGSGFSGGGSGGGFGGGGGGSW